MSETPVAAEQPQDEGNALTAFLAGLQEAMPAIPAVVNSAIDAINARNVAAAGRNAAQGDAEKAIESLVRNPETDDAEHNSRATRILDLESELRNLLEAQKVSAAPLVESLKSNVVDDETFARLDTTAKQLRATAVKLIESSAAAIPGTDVKAVVSGLPIVTGGRNSSGAGNAATGTVRPWYGRDFVVDGKKAKPLAEGGKPNLAAAAKQIEVSADDLRAKLLAHFGEDKEKWNTDQKSNPLHINGHTVFTVAAPEQKK